MQRPGGENELGYWRVHVVWAQGNVEPGEEKAQLTSAFIYAVCPLSFQKGMELLRQV